ncbi:hypothetical protein ACFL67_02860 [candidate division KSB1 bacterium]
MKHLLILALFLLFSCGQNTDNALNNSPLLKDVLTLELSFGDNESLSDYLLAKPESFCVTSNGNIAVMDEYKVKVFDSNGMPQKILGRKGQGPGELSFMYSVTCSNNDILSVVGDRIHIYNSDYTLITSNNYVAHKPYKVLLDSLKYRESLMHKILSPDLNLRTYIMRVNDTSQDDSQKRLREVLICETDKTTKIITDYLNAALVIFDKGQAFFPFLGELHYAELPEGRLVITHPAFDIAPEGSQEYYMLRIVDLKEKSKQIISHPFKRMPITFDDYSMYRPLEQSVESQGLMKMIENELEKYPGKVPVQGIITDNEYIFVFTYEAGDNATFLTDVFHGGRKEYICSVYLPFKRSYLPPIIRNGYAYYMNDFRSSGDFPVIKKYRIDPAVYGK